MQPVVVLKRLCSLFGIHSQVIDFAEIVHSDVGSYRWKPQSKCWRHFYLVCGIAFALSFPVTAWRLLLNYRIWASKSINFYVNYLYYSSRYFVIVSTFFMQVRYRRESYDHQCATIKIYRQICDINRCLANGSTDKECRRRATALNVIDWWQIVKLILAIMCYTCTSYLKLTYVFVQHKSMNGYNIFWFYYANVFVRVYASMISISISQQAKLFELLNHTMKAIKRAADASEASTEATTPSTDLPDFELLIQFSMESHDQLRANYLKLDKLHSIQALSVVGNGFLNMVSQVKLFSIHTTDEYILNHTRSVCFQFYFAYSIVFYYPHLPKSVMVFTFIQAALHFIEVKVIFGACELLKNKVLSYLIVLFSQISYCQIETKFFFRPYRWMKLAEYCTKCTTEDSVWICIDRWVCY